MVRRIAVVGLGLIGGSLSLALKRSGSSEAELVGYVRSPEAAKKAMALGLVDRVEMNLASAVERADMIVLATPVMAMKEIMAQIGPHLVPGCLVTDTASTKVEVMKWAERYLPPTVDFVGGHPMAGKETSGAEAAQASLFEGCTYCLVPGQNASSSSIQRMVDMVCQVGAKPLFVTASEHDNPVAGISHLPLVISSALVTTTTLNPSWSRMSPLAATGYRDLTRLASGHPRMSRDICATNRENILGWIDEFIKELTRFRELVAEGSPEEIEQAFIQARELRQRWLAKHDEED